MHTMSTTSATMPQTAAPPPAGSRPGARGRRSAPVLAVFAVGVGAPIYADDLSESAGTLGSRSRTPCRSRSCSR